MADPAPEPKRPERPVSGLEQSSLGLQIAAGFGLFVGLGYWTDHRLGTTPVLVVVGLVLGLAYMVYELWKLARTPTKPPRPEGAGRDQPPPQGK